MKNNRAIARGLCGSAVAGLQALIKVAYAVSNGTAGARPFLKIVTQGATPLRRYRIAMRMRPLGPASSDLASRN